MDLPQTKQVVLESFILEMYSVGCKKSTEQVYILIAVERVAGILRQQHLAMDQLDVLTVHYVRHWLSQSIN